MANVKKIGILTGGGDCPGLNAVIRAVVKTAIHDYSMEVLGILDGFEGLVFKKVQRLGYEEVRGILTKGGTILGSSNRANPFKMTYEINGKKITEDKSNDACKNYHDLGLDALVVIGGDGTLTIGKELKDKCGLQVVGVPKTIDNDLSATDVTFGFETAVITATEAIDKLHTTAESHHRVMFVEVMGRDAGWIALFSGIAGGADAILIPEIPYYMPKLAAKIERREKYGMKFSIVVVAEGARPVGGKMSVIEKPNQPWSLPRLGGAAQRVADEIEQMTRREARVTVLGHIQRGGIPTPFDRDLASRLGVEAVNLIGRQEFGRMVCLRGRDIKSASLEEAVGRQKLVDPKGEMVQAARALGIDFCSAPEKK
jgi:6-phosphofructokinase 1